MDADAGISQQQPLLARVTGRLSHPRLDDYLGRRNRYSSSYARDGTIARWRSDARAFLNSRWGHYLVLLLVTVDVLCILASFLIELHTCELEQGGHYVSPDWEVARDALEWAALVFSSLFMVELIAATLSFGLRYVAISIDVPSRKEEENVIRTFSYPPRGPSRAQKMHGLYSLKTDCG
jgi:hypothetical protein